MPQRALATPLFVLLATLLLTACSSEPGPDEFVQRAADHRARGEFRAATLELKNALLADPGRADARRMLGEVYLVFGFGPEAQKELDRARDLGDADPEIDRALLRALALQGRNETLLERLGSSDLDIDPGLRLALRADALAGLGRMEEAEAAYRESLARAPGRGDTLVGLARIQAAARDAEAAGATLAEAIAVEPDNVDALLGSAELALGARDYEQAVEYVGRAIQTVDARSADLTRERRETHLVAARVALARGMPEEAVPHVDAVAAWFPKVPLVNYLYGLAAMQQGDSRTARERLQQALSASPSDPRSLLLMALVHVSARELEQAEVLAQRLVSLRPGYLDARKLVARIAVLLGKPAEAIAVLEPVAAQYPDDPAVLAILGHAHAVTGNFTAATDYLARAVELAPDVESLRMSLAKAHVGAGAIEEAVPVLEGVVRDYPELIEGDYFLALTMMREGRLDEAIAAAEALRAKQPENPVPLNVIGLAHTNAGRFDEAVKAFEAALALRSSYVTAHLNLARVHELAGRSEAARAQYQAARAVAPGNPQALIALARYSAGDGTLDEAIELLELARTLDAGILEPRLILASYYLRRGDSARALAVAEEALAMAPGNVQSVRMAGLARLATGDVAGARVVLAEFAARNPDSAAAHLNLYHVYRDFGDAPAARAALERALEISPGLIAANGALLDEEIAAGRLDAALEIARSFREEFPQSALGRVFEARVQMAARRFADSAALYREAHELDPSVATASGLYQALWRAGERDRAAAAAQTWLSEHADDVALRMAMAAVAVEAGDRDGAIALYEAIVEVQRDSAFALNNLAWLYADAGDPRAMEFADRALRLRPESPETLDTYGWLLAESGEVQRGLTMLRQAARARPGNGSIRYHLAATMARSGDVGGARRELESLLDAGLDFPERAQAALLLGQIAPGG